MMPHIAISMYPGRDDQLKKELAQTMRRTLAQKMGLDEKIVSVSIEDVAPEKWEEHISRIPKQAMFTSGK